jgi:hypothetical protein
MAKVIHSVTFHQLFPHFLSSPLQFLFFNKNLCVWPTYFVAEYAVCKTIMITPLRSAVGSIQLFATAKERDEAHATLSNVVGRDFNTEACPTSQIPSPLITPVRTTFCTTEERGK